MNKIKQTLHFLANDLWHMHHSEHGPYSFIIKQIKIIALALRGYNEDKIDQKASALTYYTAFAAVPIVALIMAVASGFGFREFLEDQIILHFEAQKEVTQYILDFSDAYLTKSKGGVVVGIGLLILIWSVLNVLSQIENSFNDIWQVDKSRAWVRRFTDYFSMLFILPVMVLVSWGSTVFVTSKLEVLAQSFGIELIIAPVVLMLAKITPFVLYTFVFTLIFLIIPNTKVRFLPAFWAGLITGILIQLLQLLYINGQFWMSNYNAVYGSFAAVPLFLLWLYISWVMVLIGAEIAYANQNVKSFDFDREVRHISVSYRKRMAIFILHEMVKRFHGEEPPLTTHQIVQEYGLPVRLTSLVLNDMIHAGLISEVVNGKEEEDAYMPAIDINNLTVSYVLNKLDAYGENDFLKIEHSALEKINELYQKLSNGGNEGRILLKDIEPNVESVSE